ncbi:ELL-associated factor 1 [Termitomyces sp. J132]|nr:hypothetical protein H2248_005738 [Termitomyces sp. 'cryptogamus']KNZ76839.1 ELL-associated factor 1 [Termitomyces sp. J132]
MSASATPSDKKVSVTVGSSMLRALNARKSGAPRNAVPLREYYSFRYNFKPLSVDSDKRGRITVGSSSNVTVERPSSQSSEAHKWTGQEAPAQEWDCILIYDETQKSFILEKLESGLALTHQPRTGTNDFKAPAEVPTKRSTRYDGADDFEQELLDAAAARPSVSATGEDDYFQEIVPEDLKVSRREEEEEEEEGEVLPSPPPPLAKKPARKTTTAPTTSSTKPSTKLSKPIPTPISTPAPAPPKASKPLQPPPPSSAPLSTLTRAVKPTLVPPPSSAPAVPASKPQPKPVPLPRKKHKREPDPAPPASGSTSASYHFSDAEEEDLQFGKPTKRARPSQGPGLALPGASTAAFIPPPPVSATVSSVAAVEPMEVGSESDDDVWDEVAVVGKTVETEDEFDIFGEAAKTADEAEDITMDELEREINMHMDEAEDDDDDEDEDFLAAVVEEAPTSHGQPMSLKELAIGAAYASDDEYSSSEESDDD